MLNLTLNVKSWSVLAEQDGTMKRLCQWRGRGGGTNGTAGSRYKLGMHSDSNGMIINSIGTKN